jgi:hypothetical protein
MRKIEVIVVAAVFSAVYMFEADTDKQHQVEAIRCSVNASSGDEFLGVVSGGCGMLFNETETARIQEDAVKLPLVKTCRYCSSEGENEFC